MIKVLVIDDETNNRARVRELIEAHCPNLVIAGEADGVATGIQAIREKAPDLVFLDIRMGDGDAFDLLGRIGNVNFKVIFITAYEEYALKAIKFSALEYLLKPVIPEELMAAVAKAEKQILKDLNYQLSELSSNLRQVKNKRIVLKTLDKLHFIPVQEIIRCEAEKNYTTFYMTEGRKVVVSGSLCDYEDILAEQGFYRLHRSHIVNLGFVESFEKSDGGTVLLSDGSHVPVALRKKNQLIELFGKL